MNPNERFVFDTNVLVSGLLHRDSQSYVQQNPGWQPRKEFMRNGKFGMAELILPTRV